MDYLAELNRRKATTKSMTRQVVDEYREKAREEGIDAIKKNLSVGQMVALLVTPLVLGELAWHYARGIRIYCRHNRIERTRKHVRDIDTLDEDYMDKTLRPMAIARSGSREGIRREYLAAMLDGCTDEVQRIFFSTENELRRQHPNTTDERLQLLCLLVIQICKAIETYEDEQVIELRKVLPYASNRHEVHFQRLRRICEQMIEVDIEDAQTFQLNRAAIVKLGHVISESYCYAVDNPDKNPTLTPQ